MTRWRKRIGEAGAEELLKETIEAGLKLKAIKSFQLKRVNIDTTVQEKEIRFPTDARLYDRARQRLVVSPKIAGLISGRTTTEDLNRCCIGKVGILMPGR